MLGLHPKTLRRWVRHGKVAADWFGKEIRIRREELARAGLAAGLKADQPSGFDRLALASLADLWDNEADAVYDSWRELYKRPETIYPPFVEG